MKGILRRSAALVLAILISLTGTAGFAQGLDTAYMDLLLEALRQQPVADRSNFAEILKITIYDAAAIDVTKTNYQTHLSDAQKTFLADNQITSTDIVKNLEALKSWSTEDRMALIDAAKYLQKSTMLMLNDKYTMTAGPGVPVMPSDEIKSELPKGGISIMKPALAAVQSFKDMEKHWSRSYVTLLTRAGVIAGYPDGTYQPENTLTRAEVITMLVKAFAKDYRTLKPAALPTDLKTGDWHYDFMTYAAYLNLYPTLEGKALPDQGLTREKTANILANMAQVLRLSNPGGEAKIYTDVATLTLSSQEDLQWLSRLGIFSGYPDGTFKPHQVVTRAEASVLMIKMMQLFYGTLE
jgi:hypothetical protein